MREMSEFEQRLSNLLNSVNAESASNTPDFILAAYLCDCLAAWNRATSWRTLWFSPEGVPEAIRDTGPATARP